MSDLDTGTLIEQKRVALLEERAMRNALGTVASVQASAEPDRASGKNLGDLVTGGGAPGALGGFESTPGVAAVAGVARNAREIVSPVRLAKNAIGGALDFVAEADASARDLGRWLEKNVAPLGGFDYTQEQGFRYVSSAETYSQEGGIEKLAKRVAPAAPDAPAGKMARGVAQFLTGFYLTGKIPGVGALARSGGKAAAYGTTALRGALTQGVGFDPHQQRLSNLVEQFPKLSNPVTRYLQADTSDGQAEARFKSALEGLGIGLLTDGMVKAAKLTRDGLRARANFGGTDGSASAGAAPRPTVEEAAQMLDDLTARKEGLTARIGNPDEPLIQVRDVLGDADPAEAAKAVAGAKGAAKETFVNWSRIDSEDDVKAVIQDMADAFKPDVDKARRGVRTWEQTQLSAEHENAWKVLAERRMGDPLNAEESLAVRQLWVRSAAKLQETAQAVTMDPDSPAAQIAFRKMMSVHATVQNHTIAARTETARALNAWKIPAGHGSGLLKQFDDLNALLHSEGRTTGELASRVRALGEAGMPGEMDTFVRRSLGAQSWRAVVQTWYGSILSGPRTHLRNMIGSTGNLLMEITERKGAQWIGQAIDGTDAEVVDGEASSMIFGMLHGFRDALRLSSKVGTVVDAAESQADEGVSGALAKVAPSDGIGGFYRVLGGGTGRFGGAGKIAEATGGEWSPEKFGISPDSLPGRVFSALDAVTTAPGTALRAEDEVTRGMAFNAEMYALAHRKATAEVAAGAITKEQLGDRLTDLLHADDSVMSMQAELFARRATLNDPLPSNALANTLKSWSRIPVIGQLTMPFPRILYATQREFLKRTPFALANPGFYAELAKGGEARDMALSKLALGTAALVSFADLATSGQITGRGPKDPKARASLQATGWQPYSVKVGDRYYQFRGLEPLSAPLAFAGDIGELINYTDWTQPNKDLDDLGVQAMFAMGTQMTAGPFVSGTSTFFDAMSDPVRYGDAWWKRTAASVVPAAVATWEPWADPTMRDAFSAMDAIRARTPGLSDGLPAARDVWGREISVASGFGGFYDAISPVASRQSVEAPIDRELARLQHYVGKPQPVQSFFGIRVDLTRFPGTYERLTEVSGKMAFEILNGAITDPRSGYASLSDGPDGAKADLIDNVMSKSREQAKLQLLSETPALAEEVRSRKIASGQ